MFKGKYTSYSYLCSICCISTFAHIWASPFCAIVPQALCGKKEMWIQLCDVLFFYSQWAEENKPSWQYVYASTPLAARLGAVVQRSMPFLCCGPDIAARAESIPVCNPSGEMEAYVADGSQRQWFKGQKRRQSPLGKEDADRHAAMGNSYSVCGVIQRKAFTS